MDKDKDRLKSCTPEERKSIIAELQNIGCCNVCVLRYFGITDQEKYRNEELRKDFINQDQGTGEKNGTDENACISEGISKIRKKNPCTVCLGLLEHGVKGDWLQKIADAVKASEIEAKSFCPALSLPISIQIRAYSVWFHMRNKFPTLFSLIEDLKPDGIAIKSVWKWMCCDQLKSLVDPNAEWIIDGNVSVQVTATYKDEQEECAQLNEYLQSRIKKKRGGELVTRNTVQSTFHNMSPENFLKDFKCPPTIPASGLKFESCECTHAPLYIAGRYCKYSRSLSQTPWIIDGVRKTESSVEELVLSQILPLLRAESAKFSSSGREDVDVRTLGKGRPFACEIMSPKRTVFTQERIRELESSINASTDKISVHSLQIIDKKDLSHLKQGEDSKTKEYCAVCSTQGVPVTQEMMDVLNNQKLPLVLSQRTPIRVLHRRSSSDRPRSILAMKAVLVPGHTDIFTLRITTEAGTYVKEFVHGDLGRTVPNVSELLGVDTDICALDVEEVNLDWPPVIATEVGGMTDKIPSS